MDTSVTKVMAQSYGFYTKAAFEVFTKEKGALWRGLKRAMQHHRYALEDLAAQMRDVAVEWLRQRDFIVDEFEDAELQKRKAKQRRKLRDTDIVTERSETPSLVGSLPSSDLTVSAVASVDARAVEQYEVRIANLEDTRDRLMEDLQRMTEDRDHWRQRAEQLEARLNVVRTSLNN